MVDTGRRGRAAGTRIGHDPARVLPYRLGVDAEHAAIEIEISGGEECSRRGEIRARRSSEVAQREVEHRRAEVALAELGSALNGGSQDSPRLAHHGIAAGSGLQEWNEP
jgi:hypothetical protein